jgi:hypothetical protein
MSTLDHVTVTFGPENKPYHLYIPVTSAQVKAELRQMFESLLVDTPALSPQKNVDVKSKVKQREFNWVARC